MSEIREMSIDGRDGRKAGTLALVGIIAEMVVVWEQRSLSAFELEYLNDVPRYGSRIREKCSR